MRLVLQENMHLGFINVGRPELASEQFAFSCQLLQEAGRATCASLDLCAKCRQTACCNNKCGTVIIRTWVWKKKFFF